MKRNSTISWTFFYNQFIYAHWTSIFFFLNFYFQFQKSECMMLTWLPICHLVEFHLMWSMLNTTINSIFHQFVRPKIRHKLPIMAIWPHCDLHVKSIEKKIVFADCWRSSYFRAVRPGTKITTFETAANSIHFKWRNRSTGRIFQSYLLYEQIVLF